MNQRLKNAMEQLAERSAALKRLEAEYGPIEVERGRAAAVVCCSLVLEWPEAIEIAAALRERDGEKAARRAAKRSEKKEKKNETDGHEPAQG